MKLLGFAIVAMASWLFISIIIAVSKPLLFELRLGARELLFLIRTIKLSSLDRRLLRYKRQVNAIRFKKRKLLKTVWAQHLALEGNKKSRESLFDEAINFLEGN